LAQSADPDPHRSLPEAEPSMSDDLDILDAGFDVVSIEEKIALSKEMERAALAADPRIVATLRATYSDARTSVALANSQGFAGAYPRTSAAGWIQAIARDEGGQSMGIGLDFSVSPRELDPRKIGEEAGRRAADILGGQPVPTQKGSVVLHPVAGAELLLFLAQAVTAEALQKGRSFLIDREGEPVASAIVGLADDGRRRGGLASAPFDGEGTPTQLTRVVRRGVFQRPLHDHYTARKDGTRSTGNFRR
ncbi:MAG: TldD/PmbA family protein, partial [Chloroflexi bacterium]|nr:TldD/PmbA family protein [Chloroflexota bacterium]